MYYATMNHLNIINNNNLNTVNNNNNTNNNANLGGSSRLMVYVRVKPNRSHEQPSIIDVVDENSLVFDPIDTEVDPTDEYFYHGKRFKSIGVKKHKNSTYTFDKVFDSNTSNYHIYETVTRPMVDAMLNGLNCSVFAYGATGSGKTFTMLGSINAPGVIYYTSRELFGKLSTINEVDPLPAQLKICYFEIYNECIRDLLVYEPNNFIRCGNKRLRTTPERCRARRPQHDLPIREMPGDSNSLVIPDLTYHTPENADQLIELLEVGNMNRSQHPTDANADSSRSHAIFQIVLTRRTRRLNCDPAGCAEYELQTSKMSLIDLAGSERASVAYRPGNDRSKNLQREGGNINKSLLALGNCINALADPRCKNKHIPYRNSKLTRLLRDSLGGKCRTAMIATICQQNSHYDDTQNTLNYASRAKCIKMLPGRNFTGVAIQPKNYSLIIDKQNKQIETLQSQNDQLKIELEDLKNELNTLRQQRKNIKSNPNATFIAAERSSFLDESKYRQKLDSLYEEQRSIRMAILKYESKLRMKDLKRAFKGLDKQRQDILQEDFSKFNGNTSVLLAGLTGMLSNLDHTQALNTKPDIDDKEKKSLLDRARLNSMVIRDVKDSMAAEFEWRGFGKAEEFDLIIEPFVQEKEMSQELEEKKFCEQHAYDIAQTGIDRLVTTERLLNEAAQGLTYTYRITKGRGLSESLENQLAQILKRLEGKKSVIWKDDKYALENTQNGEPHSKLLSIHDNFSLNLLTPFRNNNTLHSRRLSKNLVSFKNYTPEQSNTTFDASQ